MLFRTQSGIRTNRIHESEDWPSELLRNFHHTQSFAVALGVGHSPVAVDVLLGISRLLVANHDHFMAVKAGHAADDGVVIGETTVAMNFTPVGKDTLDVLQRQRALRIPSQFCFLPGGEMCRHLSLQRLNPMVKLLDLTANVVVLPRQRVQPLQLLLNSS